jgi:hypothetical protein
MYRRKVMMNRRTALGLMGICAATGPTWASAPGDYPSRPVNVLAPFAAGGTVDIVARLVGQRLSTELKQSFLVENRGGAGGTIATAMLARAAPDGYTLMLHHLGLAFNAALYDKLPFDTERDVMPVAYVGATPKAREDGRLRGSRPTIKTRAHSQSARVDAVEAWMQVGRALATSTDAADRELARSIATFVQEVPSATRSTAPIRTPETKLIDIDPLR